MSISKIRTLPTVSIKNETSFFRLQQVGLFKSNQKSVEEFAKFLKYYYLIFLIHIM